MGRARTKAKAKPRSFLRTGDHIKVQGRLGVWHHGIVDCRGRGGTRVVHASKTDGLVVANSLRVFSDGRQIYLVRRATDGERFEIADRAREMIGEEYSVLGLNCEHVAYGASHDDEHSPQLQRFAVKAAGTVASLFLAAALRR